MTLIQTALPASKLLSAPAVTPRRESWLFVLPVLAVFLAGAIFTMTRHELWRDELQAWSIAKQSHSPIELVSNLRFEPHPPLWFLILYCVTSFSADFGPVQGVHLAISAGAVLIFLRYSPFARPQKLLFVMGYFPLYEYTIITRNYGVGMLLLFAACALWHQRHRRHITMGLLLGMLAMVNVYMAIIAIAMVVAMWHQYRTDPQARMSTIQAKPKVIAGAAIFALCTVWSVLSMGVTTSFNSGLPTWQIGQGPGLGLQRFPWAAHRVFRGLMPIPRPWDIQRDSHIFDFADITKPGDVALISVGVLIGLALVTFVTGLFLRKKSTLVYFAVAFLGMYLFTAVRFIGMYRHEGHFLMALMAGLWIGSVERDDRQVGPRWARLSAFSLRYRTAFLYVVLIAQVAAAAMFVQLDWRKDFSKCEKVAAYLRDNSLDKLSIGGEADFAVSAVAILLDKDVYFLRTRRMGKHIIWDKAWFDAQFLSMGAAIEDFAAAHPRDGLLIMNNPIPSLPDHPYLKEVARFEDNILGDEQYFLYRVTSAPDTGPASAPGS